MRSPWARCMPSSDSRTKSSTALISFFTPTSPRFQVTARRRIVGTARPGPPSDRLLYVGGRAEAPAGPHPRRPRARALVHPPPGPLNGLLPLRIPALPLVLRPLRLEGPVHLPVLAHLLAVRPVADRQPGQVGGAQRGGLLHLRPDHRDAE